MGTSSRQSNFNLIVQEEHSHLSSDINQFDFDLPAGLIAQYPARKRSQSRLLVVGAGKNNLTRIEFSEIGNLLRPGDLLICNDSRVIPARLEARKSTGGRVEILVERIMDRSRLLAQLKAGRPTKIGSSMLVDGKFKLTVVDRKRDLYVLLADDPTVSVRLIIDMFGSVPLPPYIGRAAEEKDRERYQTVYARHDGSVAAPTAGLHFSKNLIHKITQAGVEVNYLTLHVGAGTFAPVRDGDFSKHTLHSEYCQLSQTVCEAVARARSRKARVIAVGTTAVRVLETAALSGDLQAYSGETDLFIKPGFQFRVVDGLITNFHLPRSTLLMLVCAFGGLDRVITAYRHAVAEEYRFYSYGDAMFIERGGDML